MNRTLALVTLAAAALTLTACAPDTSEAFDNCQEVLSIEATTNDELTTKESIAIIAEASEICHKAADEDPAAFIAEWAD